MDQQNKFRYSQFIPQSSWNGTSMELSSAYQRGDLGSMGGEPMRATHSDSTVYMQSSTYSDGTSATLMSRSYTLGSPPAENVQYSPSYPAAFWEMSSGESSNPRTPFVPSQHEYPVENLRPTPSSLAWDMTSMNVQESYDFVVEKGKEPYFRLHEHLHISNPSMPKEVYLDEDSQEPQTKGYLCRFPGRSCWKNGTQSVFTRTADRTRHYNDVHGGTSRIQFSCDYLKCPRHKEPFTRKDHFRDHYKDYHKDDFGGYKGSRSAKYKSRWRAKQQEWDAQRSKTNSSWWRCPKCLDRVKIEKSGWTCPGCKKGCDSHLIDARTRLSASSRMDDKLSPLQTDSTYLSSYPNYTTYNDTGFVQNTTGGYDDYLFSPGAGIANEDYGEAPPNWSQHAYDDY